MDSPQPDYTTMHIKGGLLRARFLYIVLHHGQQMWSRIVAQLPEIDRAALSPIEIDNWYSLAILDHVDYAVANEIGGNQDEIFTALGEFSATSSLSGPFSSLLNPNIHAFLQQTAHLHRSYQDFGTATYDRLSNNSGLLKITYEMEPPISYTISGTAYFRKAIEMCGAEHARVTYTRYPSGNNTVFEFYATWQ